MTHATERTTDDTDRTDAEPVQPVGSVVRREASQAADSKGASGRQATVRAFLADHGWKTGLFLAVGATAAGVNLLLFLLLEGRLGMEPHLSSALATELSILWGFVGHSLVTFRRLERRRPGHHRFLLFHAVALLGLGITVLAFAFWHDLVGLAPLLSQLLALPVSTPANYLGQRYVTWKDRLRMGRMPPAPR